MVLLGNPAHPNLKPILVGQPSRIKVNANIGTSPLCNCPATEERKIKAALDARSRHRDGSFHRGRP